VGFLVLASQVEPPQPFTLLNPSPSSTLHPPQPFTLPPTSRQVELLGSAEEVQARAAHSLSVDGFHIGVLPAEGVKCERCWVYSPDVAVGGTYPGVCGRCADACAASGFELPEAPPPDFGEMLATSAGAAPAAAPAAAAGAAGAPKKVSSKEKQASVSRPPISLSKQQADFERRRMKPGKQGITTPPKPATPTKKKPAAKQVGDFTEASEA